MKLDILAFGAHPDDVELSCAGTLLKYAASGKKIGVIDLTRGELGTRGNAKLRDLEAKASTKILGLEIRENLKFSDGFFQNDKIHQLAVIRMIRKYKPKIIFANAISDRHPDHPRAAQLIATSIFLSGLIKIETSLNAKKQEPWRPEAFYHYIQDQYIQPDFVIDVSEFHSKKLEAIRAFKSQFFDTKSKGPKTYISSPEFLESISARAAELGRYAGAKHAEGFVCSKVMAVKDLFSIF